MRRFQETPNAELVRDWRPAPRRFTLEVHQQIQPLTK